MRKVKLIVHETYQGKRKSEDVFAAVFLSNAAALTPNTHSGIIKDTERSQDSLCSGKGADYYTIIEMQESLDEHISIMAKKFIDANQIKLNHALILDGTKKEKTVLYGIGSTPDQWFIKLWVIAQFPKIVFATYQSEKKTSELKKVVRPFILQ